MQLIIGVTFVSYGLTIGVASVKCHSQLVPGGAHQPGRVIPDSEDEVPLTVRMRLLLFAGGGRAITACHVLI